MAENPTDGGIYQSLNPDRREIRVVDVHPGSADEYLYLTLRVVSIPYHLNIVARRNLERLRAIIDRNENYMHVEPVVVELLEVRDALMLEIETAFFQRGNGDVLSASYAFEEGMRGLQNISEIQPLLKDVMPKCVEFMEQHGRHFLGDDQDIRALAERRLERDYFDGLDGIGLEGFKDQPYEAVSYCCGPPGPQEPLFINNTLFRVPASAMEVLRRFRLLETPRTLWIDAICINQDDASREKASQVAMMGDIYRNASNTLIWLGQEDEKTAEAVDLCRAVHPEMVKWNDKRAGVPINLLWDVSNDIRRPDSTDIRNLESIFRRPWFTRLWVVQEAINSRRLTCHIGSMSIPWSDLHNVIDWLHLHKADNVTFLPDLMNSLAVVTFDIGRGRKQTYDSLQSLASRTHKLNASDPKDRIFALLSMTKWERTDGQLPSGIRPNYGWSVRECYANATRTMIEEDNNLSVLCRPEVEWNSMSQFEDEKGLWPSWIIPWHQGPSSHQPIYASMVAEYDVDRISSNPGAQADHDVDVKTMWETNDPDLLTLKGIVVETVKGSFRADLILDILAWATDNLCDVFSAAKMALEQELGVSNPVDIASFLMLITAGLPEGSGRGAATVPYDSSKANAHAQKVLNTNSPRSNSSSTFNQDPHGLQFREAWYLTQRIQRLCIWRQFFYTSSGFVGLGPSTVLEGDVLAVLFGGSWPFLLRPQGDHYRLLGPCYLEEIMRGEAVRDWEAKGSEPMVFNIR